MTEINKLEDQRKTLEDNYRYDIRAISDQIYHYTETMQTASNKISVTPDNLEMVKMNCAVIQSAAQNLLRQLASMEDRVNLFHQDLQNLAKSSQDAQN